MTTISVQPTTSEPNEQSNELILDYRAIAKHQQKRIDVLRAVCAEAYQMAGALGANKTALDNLFAAAQGKPIPHESFLPVFATELESLQSQLKVAVEALELISKTFGIRNATQALITINKLKAGE